MATKGGERFGVRERVTSFTLSRMLASRWKYLVNDWKSGPGTYDEQIGLAVGYEEMMILFLKS